MRKNREELNNEFRELWGNNNDDRVVSFLENLNDSVTDDAGNYVDKSEYDKVVTERDGYKTQADNYRDKYINRFYGGYDSQNSMGIINSSASQAEIESQEKKITYDDLFE